MDVHITPTFYLETPNGLVPLEADSLLVKSVLPALGVTQQREKPQLTVWENHSPTLSDKKPTLVVVGGKDV